MNATPVVVDVGDGSITVVPVCVPAAVIPDDPADFAAPLHDPTSAVSRAGLRLEHVSTRVTACPYAAAFKAHGDAQLFARSYIPTLRSWTESTFFSALDPSRSLEERQTLVNGFYDAYQAGVAADPEGHGMDYVHCFMVMSKAQAA